MQFSSSPQTGGGSKNFLKLKDKDAVQVVFRGEPHEFHVKWKDKKSEVCSPDEPKAQFRFRINVVVMENGAFTAKIWEQGATVYNQLKELHEEYELDKIIVRLKRDGSERDTSYSIMPAKAQLTKELKAQIEAVELLDLSPKESGEDNGTGKGTAPFNTDEEIPW